MLESQRHRKILEFLDTRGIAAVADLAEVTGSSDATVRRDLEKMGREGLLERVRGGARAAIRRSDDDSAPGEVPLAIRNTQFATEKQRIAGYAAGLCREGELIFVDGGSTTYHLLPFLKSKRLKVVTNSFAIAAELSPSRSCTVILSGGIIYPESGIVLNPFDNSIYENFEASMVFMGAGAVTERGIENNDMRIIRAERKMLEHSRERIILADSSKFGKTGSLLLCPLEKIDTIITDSGIPDIAREMAISAGIAVIVV